MPVDLSTLISRVADCTTLHASVDTLVEQLAVLVESGANPKELAAALRTKPAADSGTMSVGAALTIKTSHLSVEKDDPLIPSVRALFESPRDDRAKHIALIDLAMKTAKGQAIAALGSASEPAAKP